MPKEISFSQISSFKKCRFAWDLQYKKRIFPKKKDKKLFLGEGVHKALEEYYSPESERSKPILVDTFNSWFDGKLRSMLAETPNMFTEEIDELKGLQVLGAGMLDNYYDFAVTHDNFQVIETEGYYKIQILKENNKRYQGHFFVFKLDGIVQDVDGKYWILEHKTSASFPDKDEFLIMDEQISYYVWATQLKFNIKLEGVLYNVLVKSLPSIPAQLLNGTTSKAKCATNYKTYLKTLQERNQEPKDYEDALSYYRVQEERFFFRTKVYRNPDEIMNTGIDIFYIAQDMAHRPRIYRNTSREGCVNYKCPYKLICMTMMDGSDVQSVIKNNYDIFS